MNLKRLVLTQIFFLTFLTSLSVYAFEGKEPGEENTDSPREMFRKEKREELFLQLNLTEDQKKQLEDNKTKNQEKRKALREQKKAYRKAIHQELMKTEIDMNKVNEIHVQLKALEAQDADDHLNSILEVRKILTPEQFIQFNSIMEKEGERFKDWKEGKKKSDKSDN